MSACHGIDTRRRPPMDVWAYRWFPIDESYHPLLREVVVVELAPRCTIPAIYDPVFPSQFYVRLDDGRRSPLLKKPIRWRHYLGEVDPNVYNEPEVK